MTNPEINIEFNKAITVFANTIPILYENTGEDLTYPALSCQFMPTKPEYPCLGSNGSFYNEGIFQVLVIDEKDKGSGVAHALAQDICNYFQRNTYLSNTNIQILKSYSSPGYDQRGYYNVPVTLNYRSWN